MDKRVVVSREEIWCDLNRVKTSISSSDIRIIPSNLRIIREEYVNGLKKINHLDSPFEIDDRALKILEQDDVMLLSNIKHIRCIFCLVCLVFTFSFYRFCSIRHSEV